MPLSKALEPRLLRAGCSLADLVPHPHPHSVCVHVSACLPEIYYRNRTFRAYYVYEASLSSFASSSYQVFAQCMFNRSVFPLLINQQCAAVCYCQQVLNDDYVISISASFA